MQDLPRDIIRKASEGDLAAFEIIYRDTVKFVHNVAFRVVNNRHDAEEITQEVFLSVYNNVKKFRGNSSFKTWVYRITANCAINYSKRIARERERRKEYFVNREDVASDHSLREIKRGTECHEEIVGSFLNVLDADQRMCIVLRNIEGLSYQQISDTLKININTVRSRLRRAKKRLLTFKEKAYHEEMRMA